MTFLALDFVNTPWFILLVLLCAFGLLALVVFLLRKKIFKKHDEEEKKKQSENDIVNEELNRVLEPIDDPKVKEQIENYSDEVTKDKKEDKK